MKAGAYDYITKPLNIDELKLIVGRALEHVNLKEEVRTLRSASTGSTASKTSSARSKALLRVLDMASRAAQTNSTVLIRGETGTGKELLAKAIHFNSPRKDRDFIAINCGAIPKDLMESELFGHVKGSFAGGLANKRGRTGRRRLAVSHEIGELPLELPVKLLRLIQQGEVAKVGAMTAGKVDVRVIAATHRNLQASESSGDGGRRGFSRRSLLSFDRHTTGTTVRA